MAIEKDHRTRLRALAAAVVLLVVGACYNTDATQHYAVKPLPETAFTRVDAVPATSRPGPVLEPALPVERATPPAQRVAAQAKTEIVPSPTPITPTKHAIAGIASWYCGHGSRCTIGHRGGLYAAIRKDLLFLTGKTVTITSGKRAVRVTIIDCNCGRNANLIDLYSDAFEKLAPLSQGGVRVTMTW